RLEEQLIGVVYLTADDLSFLIAERVVVTFEGYVVSESDGLPIDEQLREHEGRYELAGQHPDGTGQRSRPCDDPLARGGDEVPARAGDRPHRDHKRLAFGDDLEGLAHRF